MKTKIALLVLVGFVLAIVGIGSKSVTSIRKQKQLEELDNASDRGSLAWHLRRAKITGEKELELSGLYNYPFVVKDLDQALNQFRVISAVPIERYITTDSSWVLTWYKFKIIDDLSSKQAQECSSCDDASQDTESLPEALLPLNPDEILIGHIGGELIVDGIRVMQSSTIELDFSTGSLIEPPYIKRSLRQVSSVPPAHEHLSNTKPYLLFIKTDKSGKVGGLILGNRSIFSYDSNNELKAFGPPNTYNELQVELERLKINSLEKLKAYIQQLR